MAGLKGLWCLGGLEGEVVGVRGVRERMMVYGWTGSGVDVRLVSGGKLSGLWSDSRDSDRDFSMSEWMSYSISVVTTMLLPKSTKGSSIPLSFGNAGLGDRRDCLLNDRRAERRLKILAPM